MADSTASSQSLEELDAKLGVLVAAARKAGVSDVQIAKAAGVPAPPQRRGNTLRAVLVVALLAVGLGVGLQNPAVRVQGQIIGRHLMIAFRAHIHAWDYFYTVPCLIPNPYQETDEGREPLPCEHCANEDDQLRQFDMDSVTISEVSEGIKSDLIILVHGATQAWRIAQNASKPFEFLGSFYRKHKAEFDEDEDCPLDIDQYEDLDALLSDPVAPTRSWWMSWQNCQTKTARYLRANYAKPQFLSPAVEPLLENRLFMARGPFEREADGFSDEMSWTWIAQIAGSQRLVFIPPEECECDQLLLDLVAGDLVMFPADFYSLDTESTHGWDEAERNAQDIPAPDFVLSLESGFFVDYTDLH